MRPSTAQHSFGGLRSCTRDPTTHAETIFGENQCEQHARGDKSAEVSTSIPLPYRYTRGESEFRPPAVTKIW